MPAPSTSTDVVTGAIVFTDLVGFTEFTALSGDDAALELLAAQSRLVDEVLPADARVVKELGDGLLLYFRDPAERGAGRPRPPARVRSRVGVDRARRCGSASGCTPVRSASGAATSSATTSTSPPGSSTWPAPGEVLVSDAVRRDAQPRVPTVEFVELGPVVMKGIPDPIRLWRASCR